MYDCLHHDLSIVCQAQATLGVSYKPINQRLLSDQCILDSECVSLAREESLSCAENTTFGHKKNKIDILSYPPRQRAKQNRNNAFFLQEKESAQDPPLVVAHATKTTQS